MQKNFVDELRWRGLINDDNESDNDSVSSYNTSDDDNEYNYGY